jgi:hypothetical protein
MWPFPRTCAATERRARPRQPGAHPVHLKRYEAHEPMGKPPGLIEPFKSPNIDHEKEAEKHAANPMATKVTYIVLVVVLVVLFLLVGIGLHIPTGG